MTFFESIKFGFGLMIGVIIAYVLFLIIIAILEKF